MTQTPEDFDRHKERFEDKKEQDLVDGYAELGITYIPKKEFREMTIRKTKILFEKLGIDLGEPLD